MDRVIVKRTVVLVLLYAALFSPYGQAAIQEKNAITVKADHVVGEIYNLWDVRVLNAPEKWGESKFASQIQASSKHIKYIMNVRSLGGKHNGECAWFKGVDAKGEPICDFKPFLGYMKAQLAVGFTPWIVLDNVPHKMNNKPYNQYGNTSPPDDFDLWYKYIRKFIQTLVAEFGIQEVSKWHFRVGTEPDLYPGHWAGTKEEYFKHYDYMVAAVESVIKKPFIGPGNFLMHRGAQSAKKREPWTFEILEHCANGKNYYTGKTGTRITFYSQSCYAIAGQPFPYEANMKKYRETLAKYPSLKDIDYEVHEYGEIRGIQRKGGKLGYSEWFAGFYAHTIDVAYTYNVRRIFNWCQESNGLPQPWTKVTDCLVTMAGGKRVEVLKDDKRRLTHGAVAAWKDESLYVFVYSHFHRSTEKFYNDINLTIEGKRIAGTSVWSVDEQLLDKDNGVYIHQMYKDIEAVGILPVQDAHYFSKIGPKYGNNKHAASTLVEKNYQKYLKLCEMKQVRSGERIELKNGKLDLKLQLKGSGFRFLKLTPIKKLAFTDENGKP